MSGQALRTIVRTLVEIHGQHDDRALVNPTVHRQLLDAFGGLEIELNRTRTAWETLRTLRSTRAVEQARVDAAREEAEFLRHAHDELMRLAPEAGEEAALAEARGRMMQAEKVTADLRDAFEAVAGDHSPAASLSATYRRLDRRRPQAPDLIDPPAQALDAALTALDLAGQALEQALRDADYDPRELERAEERLFALRGASRKYAVEADGLADLATRIAGDLAALDAGEAQLLALDAALEAASAAFAAAAGALSNGRTAAAARLDTAVTAELAPLKLERARFITHVEPDASGGGPDGIDDVAFWVQTNPGTRPGPLMKVASGGELARFMLALKVVLADRGSAPTLVFDEIDTGVGGAIADAIGQRLARLAVRVQVLAVTHAPQVAARAGSHFRIAKDAVDKGRRVATRVAVLATDARREEIARMLAGATITEEARAAAGRLLEGAR